MSDIPSILIIEDDAGINEVLAAFLTRQGFSCTQAYSGSEARLLLEAGGSAATGQSNGKPFPFDLVITDLMLPGVSGEEIVSSIRRRGNAPVIVLSARGAAADKVDLLGLGADDYLTKPFDLEEVLARVRVQLRHAARASGSASSASEQEEPAVSGGDSALRYRLWEVDPESRTLVAAGEPVRLTRLEYNIVETLVRRPKKVFTKRELYESAWNEDCFIEEKAINVHVSNIRSKLKATDTDSYIETVWGIGFKLAD